jgi:hypothetical protein
LHALLSSETNWLRNVRDPIGYNYPLSTVPPPEKGPTKGELMESKSAPPLSQGRCIYCLTTEGDFGAKEHIIPESLGNREFILPQA